MLYILLPLLLATLYGVLTDDRRATRTVAERMRWDD